MPFEAPRETDELMLFYVTVDGVVQNSGVEYAITAEDARPTNWIPAEMLDGKTHARIDGLAAGYYRLFTRLTVGTEQPVVDLGVFRID